MNRARWGMLIAVAGVLIIVGGALINHEFGDSREPRRVSKTEYEQVVRSAYAGVRRAFQATEGRLGSIASRVASIRKELRATSKKLGGLAPPRRIREANLLLAAALEELADDLEEIRHAAATGNAEQVAAFSAGLQMNAAIRKIMDALAEMRREGYVTPRRGVQPTPTGPRRS